MKVPRSACTWRVRKGRKLEVLVGLAADSIDLCLATLGRDLSWLLKTTLALVAESASGIQALCSVQLWVPSPPALAKKAVMVGTWQKGQPVLISGNLLLSRPRVKV